MGGGNCNVIKRCNHWTSVGHLENNKNNLP